MCIYYRTALVQNLAARAVQTASAQVKRPTKAGKNIKRGLLRHVKRPTKLY